MAQLLKINDTTYHPVINEIGDIVGVFEDSHVFSKREIALFDIEKVDLTVDQVKAKIPTVTTVYKSGTVEWTSRESDKKKIWQDENGNTRDLNVDQKYKIRSIKGVISNTLERVSENLTRSTFING